MTAAEPPEQSAPTFDPRPRQLLEKYAGLAGVLLMETGEGLVEFEPPGHDRKAWGGERLVRLALAPEALEEDPDAELLTIGSPAFDRLVGAIRLRGFLESNGVIAPTVDPSPGGATIPVPLEGVTAGEPKVEVALLPVGRLLARVSIHAGPWMEERLVESPVVDLSTGTAAPQELIQAIEAGTATPEAAAEVRGVRAPRREVAELLPLLFDELEAELRPVLEQVRQEAERACKAEVDRLEQYYGRMSEEVEPEDDDPDEVRERRKTIRAEMAHRREQELERYRVRVTVHPVQLREWLVAAQRSTWTVSDQRGVGAELTARRFLTGRTGWELACPTCGGTPKAIRVCAEGHVSCPACSERCGVCARTACAQHGLSTCAVEGHPVCREHARTCSGCGVAHCSTHSGTCTIGDHEVCPRCAAQCGRCGVLICRVHGVRSAAGAPRGSRWLCGACTTYCEGSTSEPIGLDEAVRCSSCERYICTNHVASCAVDGRPHCSEHLRRSDRSGRLACGEHQAACAEEPAAVLASDEVGACVACGKVICDQHAGLCDADQARHCRSHLSALADRPGALACEAHRSICSVDGVTFSLTGTRECPVCGRLACEGHRAACRHCARQVCVKDIEGGRCFTCRNLAPAPDPADDLIQAALAANGGEPPKAKEWRTAQDASGTVVELDLGWTRRLVFTVLHGETRPRTVVAHSVLGSRRTR